MNSGHFPWNRPFRAWVAGTPFFRQVERKLRTRQKMAAPSGEGAMELGVGAVIQRQFMLLRGSAAESRENRLRFALLSRFRPLVGCAGSYRFLGATFGSVEHEEIVVGSGQLSFDDYRAARRHYLAVALFFNDRIFGEIRSLLQQLGLPVAPWVRLLQGEGTNPPTGLRTLQADFDRATVEELWDSPEALLAWMEADPTCWRDGGPARNLIHRFRVRMLRDHWDEAVQWVFARLRLHLADSSPAGDLEPLIVEAERHCQGTKRRFFDPDWEEEGEFRYEWDRILNATSRDPALLTPLPAPRPLRFAHPEAQRQHLRRILETVGGNGAHLDHLLSRYPVGRFFRPGQPL